MNQPNAITSISDSANPIKNPHDDEILGCPLPLDGKTTVTANANETNNLDKHDGIWKKMGQGTIKSVDKFYGSTTGKVVIGATIGVGVTAAAVPLTLFAVGFGAGGVVAGSVAAGIQASIGNVAAGSAFAVCQSLGATGALTGLYGFASTTVLGIPYLFRKNKKEPNETEISAQNLDGGGVAAAAAADDDVNSEPENLTAINHAQAEMGQEVEEAVEEEVNTSVDEEINEVPLIIL